VKETTPQLLLNHYLKKLKLPTILREYPAVAASARRTTVTIRSSYFVWWNERRWIGKNERPNAGSKRPASP